MRLQQRQTLQSSHVKICFFVGNNNNNVGFVCIERECRCAYFFDISIVLTTQLHSIGLSDPQNNNYSSSN